MIDDVVVTPDYGDGDDNRIGDEDGAYDYDFGFGDDTFDNGGGDDFGNDNDYGEGDSLYDDDGRGEDDNRGDDDRGSDDSNDDRGSGDDDDDDRSDDDGDGDGDDHGGNNNADYDTQVDVIKSELAKKGVDLDRFTIKIGGISSKAGISSDGIIYLNEKLFNQDIRDQVSIVWHEVFHYDNNHFGVNQDTVQLETPIKLEFSD